MHARARFSIPSKASQMENSDMAADDWSLVVGINAYPELGDLNGPESDANDFYAWVTSASGGNVPGNQATLILSSQFNPASFTGANDAKPTVERVQQAFDDLVTKAQANQAAGQGLKVGRRLYLFFAGHGFAPVFDEVVLLMANATRIMAGYHIAGRLFANWYFRSGYFDEVVLFMDCCRESYPKAPLNVPPYIDITAPDAPVIGKRFFGFGSKWSKNSWERMMPDGKVHGVFSYSLLQGLRGAAADPTGNITATSLGAYLYNNMKTFLAPEDVADPDIAKEPDLYYDPNTGNVFIFATVVPEKIPVTIMLPTDATGKTVQILGDKFQSVVSQSVTAAMAPPGKWQVSLLRGTYMVQIVGSASQKVFEVTGTEQGGLCVNL